MTRDLSSQIVTKKSISEIFIRIYGKIKFLIFRGISHVICEQDLYAEWSFVDVPIFPKSLLYMVKPEEF
jgi:hypothetical protein